MEREGEQGVELTELAAAFHPRLVRLYALLRRDTMDLGLSRSALSVLALLREHAPRRITELAAAEHVRQPSMTALVARLEERGWVERGPDPLDGRVVLVDLTEAGEQALAGLVRERVLALSKRLAALDDAEQAALAAALPALDRLIGEQAAQR